MLALLNFTLRFLIILTPLVCLALIAFNLQYLTRLEIALSSVLTIGMPWLLYEILQRFNHQRTANKAMLGFCSSMEKVFSSVSSLEETSQQAPKEMISELRMLQGLMSQIAVAKTGVGIQQPQSQQTVKKTHPLQDKAKKEPQQSADVIDIQNVSPLETADVKTADPDFKDPVTEDKTAPPLTRERLLEVIEKALNSDKIEMLVQPIVSLPQRKARHFECFSRIREEDGTIYTPDHFLHLAEEENLIRLVDNAMLFRCIQMTRSSVQKKFDVNFFCNMSQNTLADKFFFESLTEFLHTNRDLARHMVFEFHGDAVAKHLDEMAPFLRKLKLYNCRFSVDQVTDLSIDVKALRALNFKYIKFHSDVIIKAMAIESGHKQVADFKKCCDQQNMDVIVSHVESEETLLNLNDFNFDYGQGFLFGSPVLSKR